MGFRPVAFFIRLVFLFVILSDSEGSSESDKLPAKDHQRFEINTCKASLSFCQDGTIPAMNHELSTMNFFTFHLNSPILAIQP
jgi:hypothetical protein